MHSNSDRKEAIRCYKERKISQGIFVIRCALTKQSWVGQSRNLDAARNGAWFSLRHGSHIDKLLQAEWNRHGEDAFQYEILDVIDDDTSSLLIPDVLKKKKAYWIQQLNAHPL